MADYPVVSRGIGRKPPSAIRVNGETAYVTLTRGFEAIIDAQDVETVAGYRWVVMIHSQTAHAYAIRYERNKAYLMHRALLNPPAHETVDHISGDGLDNRRSNLRLATASQNQANRVMDRRNKLGLKGVWVDPGKPKPYRASIQVNGRTIHLGGYQTPEEAAAAYAGAARVSFGEFHRLE